MASATKVFTWASVASGKKQTQAEVEASRLAERKKIEAEQEAKEWARLDAESTIHMRKMLAREKQEKEQAILRGQCLQKKAEIDEKYTRENGYWMKSVRRWPIGTRCLDVPRDVSERAMEYVEHFIVTFPELQTQAMTVGAFKKAFINAYVPYVYAKYSSCMCDQSTLIAYLNAPRLTNEDKYALMQMWLAEKETKYNRMPNDYNKKLSQPWRNAFWVFAKNVTFEKCLWAMDAKSKTFEMPKLDPAGETVYGFVKIEGNPLHDASKIVWQTDLANYIGHVHKKKPENGKKLAQREKEIREEDLDDLF